MPRVKQETINKLRDLINSLPDESRNKCALCNETLTHIVKQAEAQIGAGTATVTRVLAEEINKDAAPRDRVTGEQLRQRTRYNEDPSIWQNSPNKPTEPETADDWPDGEPTWTCKNCGGEFPVAETECYCQKNPISQNFQCAQMAIVNLERINKKEADWKGAYQKVSLWISKNS